MSNSHIFSYNTYTYDLLTWQHLFSHLSLSHFREVYQEEVTQHSNRKTSSLANGLCSPFTTGDDGKPEVDGQSKKVAGDDVNYGVGVEDLPPDGWPLRRVFDNRVFDRKQA